MSGIRGGLRWAQMGSWKSEDGSSKAGTVWYGCGIFKLQTSNFLIHTSRRFHDDEVDLVLLEDGLKVVSIGSGVQKFVFSGF